MTDIYINNKVRLDRFGLRVRDLSNHLTELHKRQGDIDGACVVYSVIMSLLCLGYINGSDIDVYASSAKNGKEDKDKFLNHLLREQGFILDGYYLSTMAKEIRKFLPDLNVMYHRKKSNFMEHIFTYVEEDNPVIITVVNSQMNHAVLVIGVEYDENDDLTKLFCLDPSEPLDGISYWNCIIDTSKGMDENSVCWYITNSAKSKVEIKEIMALEEGFLY